MDIDNMLKRTLYMAWAVWHADARVFALFALRSPPRWRWRCVIYVIIAKSTHIVQFCFVSVDMA